MTSYEDMALVYLVFYLVIPMRVCVLTTIVHPGAVLSRLLLGVCCGLFTVVALMPIVFWMIEAGYRGARPYIIVPMLVTLATALITWRLCDFWWLYHDGR